MNDSAASIPSIPPLSSITSPRSTCRSGDADRGFTLVEILIVIVVIGVLSVVVVFSVRGIVDRGETASCDTDARTLIGAGEAYLAERVVDSIPATGAPADTNSYEQTLVDAGLLREVSALHELDSDAKISWSAPICP